MAATKLGYLLTKCSFWLKVFDTYQFLGMEAKNYKLGIFCQQCHPSVAPAPWWRRYSTKKCLPDSHLPFVYVVVLSISPIWGIRETNPSRKTSKILFWIVMATFRKSCHRPWLHGLKNQSQIGSSNKFSKMAATRPARGHCTMNFQWKKRFREMALWACAVARVPGKLCQFA